MARELSDDELACKLEEQQIDRVVLNEAAKRIRECELRSLLHTNEVIEAINRSPLLSAERQQAIVEQIVLSVQSNRQSSSRLSSLASRVWRTGEATREETRSLAASVMSQDETRGQS